MSIKLLLKLSNIILSVNIVTQTFVYCFNSGELIRSWWSLNAKNETLHVITFISLSDAFYRNIAIVNAK